MGDCGIYVSVGARRPGVYSQLFLQLAIQPGVNPVPFRIILSSFVNNRILALKFYSCFPNFIVRFLRGGAISFVYFFLIISMHLTGALWYLYNFDFDQLKMNFRFSVSRFSTFSAARLFGEKVLWTCVRRKWDTVARAGSLALVLGLSFLPPSGIYLTGLSLFIGKASWLEVTTTLTLISPKQHNLLVFGSFILPDLIQPTHVSEIRSVTIMEDKCRQWRWWGVLRDTSAVHPVPWGKLQSGRKFEEATEREGWRPGGKGREQDTAAHLVLQQIGLKHTVLAAKRKVTRNLKTGNLIITKASKDTSNLLMFSSSLDYTA